jgi:ABC-type amino acid transport substrate-binding protein
MDTNKPNTFPGNLNQAGVPHQPTAGTPPPAQPTNPQPATTPNPIPPHPAIPTPAATAGIPLPQPPQTATPTPAGPNPPPPSMPWHPSLPSSMPPLPILKKRIAFPLVLVFLIVTLLIGMFLGGMTAGKKTPETILKTETKTKVVEAPKKTLVVGTDATSFPMTYSTKEGGVAGYDIDLAYRIANTIGYTVVFKNLPWNSLFNDLKDKKIDVIISYVTINADLKRSYSFSDTYLTTRQTIVTRSDSTIASIGALQGEKVGVQKWTNNATEVVKYTTPDMVVSYDSLEEAAKAVNDGTVAALLTDSTIAKNLVSQHPGLKIATEPFTTNSYGIVLRKDQGELLKKVNEALSKLQVDGTLTALKDKWLD